MLQPGYHGPGWCTCGKGNRWVLRANATPEATAQRARLEVMCTKCVLASILTRHDEGP